MLAKLFEKELNIHINGVSKLTDINEQLRGLGDDHPEKGVLIRTVRTSYKGAGIAADVVIAMANQIGKERQRAMNNRISGDYSPSYGREVTARMDAIHELAGRLGLGYALRVVLEQPIPDEGGRVITPPQEIVEDPEAVAVQLAILGAIDRVDASAEMPGRGKTLNVYAGGPGIDSALDDFEDF